VAASALRIHLRVQGDPATRPANYGTSRHPGLDELAEEDRITWPGTARSSASSAAVLRGRSLHRIPGIYVPHTGGGGRSSRLRRLVNGDPDEVPAGFLQRGGFETVLEEARNRERAG